MPDFRKSLKFNYSTSKFNENHKIPKNPKPESLKSLNLNIPCQNSENHEVPKNQRNIY